MSYVSVGLVILFTAILAIAIESDQPPVHCADGELRAGMSSCFYLDGFTFVNVSVETDGLVSRKIKRDVEDSTFLCKYWRHFPGIDFTKHCPFNISMHGSLPEELSDSDLVFGYTSCKSYLQAEMNKDQRWESCRRRLVCDGHNTCYPMMVHRVNFKNVDEFINKMMDYVDEELNSDSSSDAGIEWHFGMALSFVFESYHMFIGPITVLVINSLPVNCGWMVTSVLVLIGIIFSFMGTMPIAVVTIVGCLVAPFFRGKTDKWSGLVLVSYVVACILGENDFMYSQYISLFSFGFCIFLYCYQVYNGVAKLSLMLPYYILLVVVLHHEVCEAELIACSSMYVRVITFLLTSIMPINIKSGSLYFVISTPRECAFYARMFSRYVPRIWIGLMLLRLCLAFGFRIMFGYLAVKRFTKLTIQAQVKYSVWVYLSDFFVPFRMMSCILSGSFGPKLFYSVIGTCLLLFELSSFIEMALLRLVISLIDFCMGYGSSTFRLASGINSCDFDDETFKSAFSNGWLSASIVNDLLSRVGVVTAELNGSIRRGVGFMGSQAFYTVSHVVNDAEHIRMVLKDKAIKALNVLNVSAGDDPVVMCTHGENLSLNDIPYLLKNEVNIVKCLIVANPVKGLSYVNKFNFLPGADKLSMNSWVHRGDSGSPVFALLSHGGLRFCGTLSAGCVTGGRPQFVSLVFGKTKTGSPGVPTFNADHGNTKLEDAAFQSLHDLFRKVITLREDALDGQELLSEEQVVALTGKVNALLKRNKALVSLFDKSYINTLKNEVINGKAISIASLRSKPIRFVPSSESTNSVGATKKGVG